MTYFTKMSGLVIVGAVVFVFDGMKKLIAVRHQEKNA